MRFSRSILSFRCSSCLTFVFLFLGSCYRTPLLPPACDLEFKPVGLDFGRVVPGDAQTQAVAMVNHGEGECRVKNVTVDSRSDPGFALAGAPSVVGPSATATISVTFRPVSASIPLNRKGNLVFDVDSTRFGHVSVPLSATVISDCRLNVAPSDLAFGHVAIDTSASRSVRATNEGTTACEIGNIAIRHDSDAQFHLVDSVDLVTLLPGGTSSVSVAFEARDAALPHRRTGTLGFDTNDSTQMTVDVPLLADIDVGCDLSWEPASIDFGTLTLNKTTSRQLVLSNSGSATCEVSNVSLTANSASSFRLLSGLPSMSVPAGKTASIVVTFTADSSLPHDKLGTVEFRTGNPRNPTATVSLSGHVNTPCEDASQWIYTFDEDNGFARFDPKTTTFAEIATLKCAASGTPFSMAVDQHAVAWVHYSDGSLFKVDTTTGACERTAFKPDQHGIHVFGMGFVFDPSTGDDRLFIAGDEQFMGTRSQLATVSFPDLIVVPIGAIATGSPELSGTGDGQLWGFSPPIATSTSKAILMRLDPATGATIESYAYPSITTSGAWSMKFWGGNFWIFLGTSVYKVSRANPKVIETVIGQTGRPQIVGAGVSTCAPL